MDAQGKVLIPLDEEQVRARRRQAVSAGVAGHRHPVPALLSQSGARAARQGDRRRRCAPSLFVTASHELSQEYREFERTSTAAANAYVGPRVRDYLTEMDAHLDDAGFAGNFLIVQSTGGLVRRRRRARVLHPHAGVRAGRRRDRHQGAVRQRSGSGNAIAFDMGGTTAKAGVIYDGNVLMTGGALIGGYATGLPVQMPMIDIQEVGTGGGSIARVETRRRAARRTGKRGRRAGTGLLRAWRHRADHHRRQSGARPARRRPLPRRRDEARSRRRASGARREDREAARTRPDRSRRRHPAHRHHQDVARGALGDHRARARRRRFRAGRLWRRRAAARRHGGARACASAKSSFRARRGISRPTACWSPTCAAISSTPGSRRSPRRRSRTWKDLYQEMERRGRAGIAARQAICRKSSSSAPPTCAMSARSTPSRVELPIELFAAAGSRRHQARFDAVHETRYGYAAPGEKAEIVSLRCAVIGLMTKPRQQTIAAGGGGAAG